MKEQNSESSVVRFRPVSAFEETHELCVLVVTIDIDVAMYNSNCRMQFPYNSNCRMQLPSLARIKDHKCNIMKNDRCNMPGINGNRKSLVNTLQSQGNFCVIKKFVKERRLNFTYK
jgi:hypothetical protein